MLQWRALASEEGRRQRTIAERLRLYREQTRVIAARHPKETAQAYLRNTAENLRGGWSWLDNQLPRRGGLYELAHWASRWEGRARAVVPVLLLAALLATGRQWRVVRSPISRQAFACACGLIMAWGYFVVLGGTAYWHGPRLMYPTSVAVLATMALGVGSLAWRRRVAPGARVERGGL